MYGPLEVKRGVKEQIERATIDVVWRPRIGPSGNLLACYLFLIWFPADYTDREKEYVLRGVLEGVIITTLHPRTSISVVVQVIQDDGSVSQLIYFIYIILIK